jgi:hypothetical protein
VTLSAVLSVVHRSHEDTSAAVLRWALPPQALNLAIAINLVVLENGQLGLLTLVLDLLGCAVDLLLALFCTTAESEDKVESRLFLDVVIGQGTAVFQLLAGEDQTLLVGWDTFLVCSDVNYNSGRGCG